MPTAEYKIHQHGDQHGLPGWWTVYKDGQAFYHWPRYEQAYCFVDELKTGATLIQAHNEAKYW